MLGDMFDNFRKNPRRNFKFEPGSPLDITRSLHRVLMLSFMMGMDHANPDTGISIDTDEDLVFAEVVPEPLEFEEAIALFRSRIPMTEAEFYDLDSKMRFRAFTVARLSQLDAIDNVRNRLVETLLPIPTVDEKGRPALTPSTLEEFWRTAGEDELLKAAGFHESAPYYWENVYRTNIQSNYSAGHMLQYKINPPDMLEFIGIADSRQSDICRNRNGIRRKYEDPFWDTNTPPLHFQCRSRLRPIYESEKNRRNARSTRIPKNIPSPQEYRGGSFGMNALDSGTFYKLTAGMRQRAEDYGILKQIERVAQKLELDMDNLGLYRDIQVFKGIKEYKTTPDLRGKSEGLKRRLQETEHRIKDYSSEELYIFDQEGRLLYRNTGSANKVAVHLSPEEMEWVRSQRSVLLHNHPGMLNPEFYKKAIEDGMDTNLLTGNSFSPEDIALMLDQRAGEMRVINRHYIHVFKPGNNRVKFSLADDDELDYIFDMYKSVYKAVEYEISLKLEMGLITKEEASNSFFHMINTRLANDLGWNYKRYKYNRE